MNSVLKHLAFGGLAIWAVHVPVHAAEYTGNSWARISELTFTLVDLAPADGIAPSFEFLAGSIESTLSADALSPGGSASPDRVRQQDVLDWSDSLTAEAEFVLSQASVDRGTLGAFSWYVIQDDGSHYSLSSQASAGFDVDPLLTANISLGPHTGLKISAGISMTVWWGSDCSPCHGDAIASASASLAAYADPSTPLILGAPWNQTISVTGVNKLGQWSEYVEVTIFNPTSQAHDAAFRANVSTVASLAVPEPSAWLMALAGLGVAGIFAGRGRRAQWG